MSVAGAGDGEGGGVVGGEAWGWIEADEGGGGPRVERERLGDGVWVVHNYGHGGYGYQASYGSAWEVERLVEGILKEKEKARL